MGDAFAEGWVHRIGELVTAFANPPEIDEAIERHVAEKNAGTADVARSIKKADIGRAEMVAAQHGAIAAAGESLYRPMQADSPRVAIGMEGGAA